jgi:two-component system sensor histidine kinase/response regulator
VNTLFTLRHKISSLWVRLTGDPLIFPLEHRIAHSIYLIAIVSLAYNVPFNLLVNLPVPALISLVAGMFFTFLYYRSRFMGKMHSVIVVGAALGNFIFIINYFYNSGLNGPTDILLALSILLVISITPHKQHKIWLSLNIITVLVLHLTEYYYPHLVPDSYEGRPQHFIDSTSAYIVVVIVMYYTIKYIRRNYDYEKRQAEEKTHAIEDQNQYILVQNEQLETSEL